MNFAPKQVQMKIKSFNVDKFDSNASTFQQSVQDGGCSNPYSNPQNQQQTHTVKRDPNFLDTLFAQEKSKKLAQNTPNLK